jgi:hypothetical protein
METCDFQVPAKPKSLNRSTWNFPRIITLARLRDVPKMVGIGRLGAAPHIGEIKPQKLYYTLPLFLHASTDQTTYQFAQTMAQTTRFAVS